MESTQSTAARRDTEKSEELWLEAQKHLVGGVNSPVRAYNAVRGTPPFPVRGDGAYVESVDGVRYVDFVGSFGPLILGHADPEVTEAVCDAARRGTSFAATHEGEIDLARRVKELVPGVDKLRLVNSGTEAVQSALRLARGVTGRDLIIKFDGCYHGHVDSLLVKAGSGLATFGIVSSSGVTQGAAADTLVLPLDDESALETAFERDGDRLAAAIIEPLPANNGLLVQRPEFLRRLRQLCTEHGALLIFDEVISGLRVSQGSMAAQLEIAPDLWTLGKVIGGGLPVGAYGGSARLMDHLSPLGPVYQAGTLSGNPLAVAGGLATLRVLAERQGWQRLEALGGYLKERLEPVLAASSHPYRLVQKESLFWFSYGSDDPPRRVDRIPAQAAPAYAALHEQLLKRRWMFAPSAFEVAFLSLSHTEEMIDQLAMDLGASLSEMEF